MGQRNRSAILCKWYHVPVIALVRGVCLRARAGEERRRRNRQRPFHRKLDERSDAGDLWRVEIGGVGPRPQFRRAEEFARGNRADDA